MSAEGRDMRFACACERLCGVRVMWRECERRILRVGTCGVRVRYVCSVCAIMMCVYDVGCAGERRACERRVGLEGDWPLYVVCPVVCGCG